MRRRAGQHLTPEEANQLSDDVERLRASIRASKASAVPFAPSGKAIEGKTAAERDDAFGRSLLAIAPRLAKGDVWTLADAQAAEAELCDKPLDEVPVGIAFDPLSRDPIRPLDGPALGDWIPDIGLSPEGTKAFVAACAASKLPDGSYDVPAIDAAIIKAEGAPKSTIAQLSRLKRLALLRYAGFLETGKRLGPIKLGPSLPEDPVWAIGKLCLQTGKLTPEAWGMTEAMAKRAGSPLGKPIDMSSSALAWMWLGWIIDPSLQSTSGERFTKFGTYLTRALWDVGPYPWHAAYFASRRPLEERRHGSSTACLQPEMNVFVNAGILESNLPKAPRSQSDFVTYCAGLLRMDCLLIGHDLDSGRKLDYPASAKQQLSELWVFVRNRLSPEDREKTGTLVIPIIERIR